MSFSQLNRRLNEEPEYRYAFLTTKNGNSTRRFSTCTFVNLQFAFFSVPIWSGRMFMHSITLIIASIARLFSFSEKKLLKSEIIVVTLPTASKFALYCLAIVKLLIFSELSKLRSLFYSYFMLNLFMKDTCGMFPDEPYPQYPASLGGEHAAFWSSEQMKA